MAAKDKKEIEVVKDVEELEEITIDGNAIYTKMVTVGIKRTFNLGIYESLTMEATSYTDIGPDVDPEYVLRYKFIQIRRALIEQAVKELCEAILIRREQKARGVGKKHEISESGNKLRVDVEQFGSTDEGMAAIVLEIVGIVVGDDVDVHDPELKEVVERVAADYPEAPPQEELFGSPPAKKKTQTKRTPPKTTEGNGKRTDVTSWKHEDEKGGYFDVHFIKVVPQPDGRANVEFWRRTRKYAEIYITKWEHDSLAEMFQGAYEAVDFKSAFQQDCPCRVNFEWGREMPSGKGNYKDVTSIDFAEE